MTQNVVKGRKEPTNDFLSGGGEVARLIRTFDWTKSDLGPVDGWPQSLKTVVRIMLDSRYAMWLGWGPNLTFLYNDAYAKMTLGPNIPGPWAGPLAKSGAKSGTTSVHGLKPS